MNRYLKMHDPRNNKLEWLVRLVGDDATYTDMRSGKPVEKIAKRDESHVLEFHVRVMSEPGFGDFAVVGCALLSELGPQAFAPNMAYNGFPMSLNPEMKRWVLAWSQEGFPYGGCIENPAIVGDLVIAVIDSGAFKRHPVIVFSAESKGLGDLWMKAVKLVQGRCSNEEGAVQMLTYHRPQAEKLTDAEIEGQIIDVCQGQ